MSNQFLEKLNTFIDLLFTGLPSFLLVRVSHLILILLYLGIWSFGFVFYLIKEHIDAIKSGIGCLRLNEFLFEFVVALFQKLFEDRFACWNRLFALSWSFWAIITLFRIFVGTLTLIQRWRLWWVLWIIRYLVQKWSQLANISDIAIDLLILTLPEFIGIQFLRFLKVNHHLLHLNFRSRVRTKVDTSIERSNLIRFPSNRERLCQTSHRISIIASITVIFNGFSSSC